jgi:hypothetical protein
MDLNPIKGTATRLTRFEMFRYRKLCQRSVIEFLAISPKKISKIQEFNYYERLFINDDIDFEISSC